MMEEKRAELYPNPGGRCVRADTLSRILAHWRSLSSRDKSKPTSSNVDGRAGTTADEEVDKLQGLPL